MTSDTATRRRRAAYRANHRGTKEMDWLVGRYADACLDRLEGEALDRFEAMLEVSDVELQSWILDPELTDRSDIRDLLLDLRSFHGLGNGGTSS